MAKKKDDESAGDSSFLLSAMAKAAENSYQTGIYTGTQATAGIIGLPLTHLSQRWLYQSSVYPLGRVKLLVGKPESGKSAYLSEVLRWHIDGGGCGMIRGTEGRDIKDLRDSTIGYRDSCDYQESKTLEHWQSHFTFAVRAYHKQFEEHGDQQPVCLGLDSLRGANSRKVDDKIDALGYADPSFATEAKQCYAYLRYISKRLEGTSLSLVITNHLLDAINTNPHSRAKATTYPGGEGQRYFATFVVEVVKLKDISNQGTSGRRIKLRTLKNSLGSEARLKLEIEMIWWHDADGLQRTVWDWDKATTELLIALQSDKNVNPDGELRKAIRSVVDLTPCSRGSKGKGVCSLALDIPKSDPISFRDMGALLERKYDLLAQIEPLLHIKQRGIYKFTTDYLIKQPSATVTTFSDTPEVDSDSDGEFGEEPSEEGNYDADA